MKQMYWILALCLSAVRLSAQEAVGLKQRPLSDWGIGPAQFSGIAPMGNARYALVSDKEATDGFFVFHIEQDSVSGEVTHVALEGFRGNPSPRLDAHGISLRDCEGVAFVPGTQTVFISGEGDQEILEYRLDGVPTGRGLHVPPVFSLRNIVPNYGFEALTFSPETGRFWTTSESMLPHDGKAAGPAAPGVQNLLRLQSFDIGLQPVAQYAYRMDRGKTDDFGRNYAYGVPAMTALPDGRLLVLERELDVSNGYLSSECVCKLFEVNPSEGWQIDSSTDLQGLDPNRFLIKRLLLVFKTSMTPFRHNFANYEGMCLGRTLADGRRTLLLVCDSQGGFGKGPVHLKDYIKVVILGN
ncbi:MAG: esterase-like activity of phytase family protein [Bacteroidaceae bacterium]|nr:esterase-like activity of phytase family protein [Bacteroidaceae bacterium]